MVRFLLCLITLPALVYCTAQSSSDSSYFDELYDSINANISNGNVQQNLMDYPLFVKEAAFQALNCHQKGKIFHRIGVSYYLEDQENEAITLFRDSALVQWTDCQGINATERANTLYNIGICYQYLGKVEAAKKYLDESLLIFEQDQDYPPYNLANKYQGIAAFYRDNYNPFRAELYYQNALNIYEEMEGTELDQFYILNDFLLMSMDFRKYEMAKGYFERALRLSEKAKEEIDDIDLCILYQNAGIIHYELGELDQAMQKSRFAMQLIDSVDYPDLYTNGVEKIALINGNLGQFEKAIEALDRLIAVRRQNQNNSDGKINLAYAYENMSEVYLKKKEFDKAQEWIDRAIEQMMVQVVYDNHQLPIIKSSIPLKRLDLIRMLDIKSQVFQEAYQTQESPDLLEKSLTLHAKIDTLINQAIFTFQFEKSQLNFVELVQQYYGNAVTNVLKLYDVTKKNAYLELAYQYTSKTKAFLLQNRLRETDAFASVASKEMIQKEQQLVQRIFDLQEQIGTNVSAADSLLRAYTEAQRALENFLSEIEAREPLYYQQKYAFVTPPVVNDIQEKLPRDLAVLEFFYSSDFIYSFWITKDRFFVNRTIRDDTFDASLTEYIDQCHDPAIPFNRELGEKLYQKLLQPGLQDVQGDISRLCILSDGQLHNLSFESLPTGESGKNWLIESYGIFYAYSTGLSLVNPENKTFETPYLGFATQYSADISQKLKQRKLLFGTENLAQLTLSNSEIERASALLGGNYYLDKEASRANFLKQAPGAKILHFSLHGLVDFEDPLRSCILFDDHHSDFILSAADLYVNRTNADLVVLSACHSADGKIYNGEGVQGMSKAFMVSGTKNVLSSLWSASEVSSLDLMTSFFEQVKGGLSYDKALHQAKLKYLSSARPSQQHPFYWSNFILIGTIQPAVSPFFSIKNTGLLALIILLIVGAGIWMLRRN